MKIIECVPNFSEGRRSETFDAMSLAVKEIPNVKLLSLEPDADYNRVVVTLAGDEKGILEGAVAISRAAAQSIDMRLHKGEHPRLGAIDVVPFVPVRNATMEECIRLSEQYAQIISEDLNVPVFLYEEAARRPERRTLANIRKGEYEGLADKLKNDLWIPDYGTCEFNPQLGAVVTGARFFLIAYNVNLKTPDISYAKEISERLRESGRPKRDENGNIIKENGVTVRIPGRLRTVQAMGVYLEKYNITQVSMNLKNYNVVSLHQAFEEVKAEAGRMGIETNGSEIVGLVPLEAIIKAGQYYAGQTMDSEKTLVNIAIDRLGLSTLNPFSAHNKIIDYMI